MPARIELENEARLVDQVQEVVPALEALTSANCLPDPSAR
jgi:hypothetical protein